MSREHQRAVWVVVKLGDEEAFDASEVQMSGAKISHLRGQIKIAFAPELDHVAPARLKIFRSQADSKDEAKSLRGCDNVPSDHGSTAEQAFFVTCPAKSEAGGDELTQILKGLKLSQEAMQESQAAVKGKVEAMQLSQEAMQLSQEAMQESQAAVKDKVEAMQESQAAVKDKVEAMQESQAAVKDKVEAMQESQAAVKDKVEAMQHDVDAIRTNQFVMNQKLAYVDLTFDVLNPSKASGTQKQAYMKLLGDMKLDTIENNGETYTETDDVKGWPPWSWKWEELLQSVDEREDVPAASTSGVNYQSDGEEVGGQMRETDSCVQVMNSSSEALERTSYRQVVDYVSKVFGDSYQVADVSYGTGLTDGLMFHTQVFSCRQDWKIKSQKVFYLTTIKGRPDVLVADAGQPISRSCARAAIEIKQGTKAGTSGQSEAISQLLALNVNHVGKPPFVILTNLVRQHTVFWIKQIDTSPFFSIVKQECSTFRSALQFVLSRLPTQQAGYTYELGRGPSPQSSPLESDATETEISPFTSP